MGTIDIGADPGREVRGERIRTFCDAYELSNTDGLLATVVRRQQSTYDTIRTLAKRGEPAYQRMWDAGNGDGILREQRFVKEYASEFERYL